MITGQAVADLIDNEAMGAVVGPAGLGKTFAIAHATSELLMRPRRSSGPPPDNPVWPGDPTLASVAAAQRLRRRLSREEFQRVDQLLFATHRALERWLRTHRRPNSRQRGNAIRVLRTAHDPTERHIRECAIVVALRSAGYKPPRRTRTTRRHRELTDHTGWTLGQVVAPA